MFAKPQTRLLQIILTCACAGSADMVWCPAALLARCRRRCRGVRCPKPYGRQADAAQPACRPAVQRCTRTAEATEEARGPAHSQTSIAWRGDTVSTSTQVATRHETNKLCSGSRSSNRPVPRCPFSLLGCDVAGQPVELRWQQWDSYVRRHAPEDKTQTMLPVHAQPSARQPTICTCK
jgi:hypothetical protein